MATVGSLVVNLLGNTQQFRKEFGRVPEMIQDMSSRVSQIGTRALLAGAAFAGFSVKLAAEAEASQIAFEVLTGSANTAKKVIGELRTVADASSFSMKGITEAGQLLLNFGTTANDVVPTIKMLGDIAGGDENKLHSLALAFGQSSSAGRLMGQDLNQMINAGFNPLVEISKRTGETMSMLKSRMEAGGISTAEVTQAFKDATSEGGRFFGMTERQSNTVSGLFSTMMDTVQGICRTIGEEIMKAFDLRQILRDSIAWLQSWSEWIGKNGRDIIYYGTLIASFTAGITLMAMALGTAVAALILFTAIGVPGGIILLTAGIAAATVATLEMNRIFDNASARMGAVDNAAMKAARSVSSVSEAAKGTGSALANELQQLQKIHDEMAQSDLAPNYRAGLQKKSSALVGHIDSLTAVSPNGNSPAMRPVDLEMQKLNDLREASRLAAWSVQSVTEDTGQSSAMISQLEKLAKIQGELAQPDLAPNYGARLKRDEAAVISSIEEMKLQMESLRKESQDPFDLFHGAEIEENIGRLSGATAELRALNDQLNNVSADELKRRKIQEDGATNEMLAEIEQKQSQLKSHKELMQARESVISRTESPTEKFTKQIEDLHNLQKGNFITDEQFSRGKELAASDLAKSEEDSEGKQKKNHDNPLSAIFAASKEAQSSIMRGITNGNSNPNGKLETLAERHIKATEKGNAILAQLTARDEENSVIVIDYP